MFPHQLCHRVTVLHRPHGWLMLITVCSKLVILNKHTKQLLQHLIKPSLVILFVLAICTCYYDTTF